MFQPAPELQVATWLNTPHPLSLQGLRGKVVLIEAFQMLCPGCVSHGLPQAARVASSFDPDEVVVLGLHTVFEHHEAQGTRVALEAFLHEYRWHFPVAIDAPSPDSNIPQTMAAYGLRGTPSQILIDREGNLRKQAFGAQPDLMLGAEIADLLREPSVLSRKSVDYFDEQSGGSSRRSDAGVAGTTSRRSNAEDPSKSQRNTNGLVTQDTRVRQSSESPATEGCDDGGCALPSR